MVERLDSSNRTVYRDKEKNKEHIILYLKMFLQRRDMLCKPCPDLYVPFLHSLGIFPLEIETGPAVYDKNRKGDPYDARHTI